MVQGLGFLSKKSWHTKNLNNQEKVWIAEQQQEQERIKTSELAKQIQIEREQNEIDDMTGGISSSSGKKRKIYDRGIDWMYSGQTKDSQIAKEDAAKLAEEYLLGKPIAFQGGTASLSGGEISSLTTTANASTGINRAIDAVVELATNEATTTTVAALDVPTHNTHDDDDDDTKQQSFTTTFRNNHKYEDPMYMVSLQTVRKEKMIEQQKELYERVGIGIQQQQQQQVAVVPNGKDDRMDAHIDMAHGSSKFKKAYKKSKKKKKKRSSSKYTRYDDSDDDDDDDSKHRKKHSKQRSRDDDGDEQHRSKKQRRHHNDNESYDSDHYSGSSYSDDRNQRGRSTTSTSSRLRSNERDSFFNNNNNNNDKNNSDERYQHCEAKYDTKALHSKSCTSLLPLPQPEHDKDVKTTKYGLVTKHKASDHHHHHITTTNDLGPDRELIERKREEKYHKNSHYSNRYHCQSGNEEQQSRQHRSKDPEERARALRDMEENAKTFDMKRRQPPQLPSQSEQSDERNYREGGGATFIREISQKVHGIYK